MAYDAFISYSHAADGRLAPALQSALHRFAKPWYRLRALSVFRDKTSLSATPALWPSIERALSASSHFVLLASPEAARSVWVEREANWWLEHRPAGQLLVVLTDGDLVWDTAAETFDRGRTTALAPRLLDRFHEEPLWVDLRWAKSAEALSLRHPQFRGAVLDLAAPLHGRPKEELDGEDVRQHRRTRAVAVAAVVAIAAAAVVAGWQAVVAVEQRHVAEQQRTAAEQQRGIAEEQRDLATRRQAEAEAQRRIAVRNEQEANHQRRVAEQRYRQALGRQLAIQAERTRTERPEQLQLSVLLAAEAVRNLPSIETDRALRAGLALLPRLRWKAQHPSQRAIGIHFSPDGRRIVTSDGVWDAASGRRLAEIDHDRRSTAFALSLDGTKLARGGGQQTAGVWDAATGKALSGPLRNAGPLTALAFSPDGRLLAAASQDQMARIWDAGSGAPVQSLAHLDGKLSGPMAAVAFSPDGRYFAAARRNAIGIWDAATWQPMAVTIKIERGAIQGLAFSPDSSHVLAATGSQAELFDLAGKQASTLPFGSDLGHPLTAAFSPDGRYAGATGRRAGVVWEVATGRVVTRAGRGGAMAFSPDGTRVALGADTTSRVIDLATAREVVRMAHAGSVDAVAFSPDSALLVTASSDASLRLWEASASAHVARIEGTHQRFIAGKLFTQVEDRAGWLWEPGNDKLTRVPPSGPARSLTLSADGARVAAASGDTVTVWSLPETKEVARLAHTEPLDWDAIRQREEDERKRSYREVRPEIERMQEEGSVRVLAFSGDGRYLLTTRADELARLWDASTGRELLRIPYAQRMVAAFSEDRTHLATASPGQPVSVWNLRSRQARHVAASTADVRKLLLSRDASHVVSIGDHGAELWNVRGAAAVATLPNAHEVTPSADGRFLLTAEENIVRLWDLGTGRAVAKVECPHGIGLIRFSPDGRHFAVVDDSSVRVRSVDPRGLAHDLGYHPLTDIAFSADGSLLAGAYKRIGLGESEANPGQPRATGKIDTGLKVWDLRGKRELFAAAADVGGLVFSPDGRYLAGGDTVWEAATGREVTRVDGRIVAFSPNLSYLISVEDDWTRVWVWRPGDLVAEACGRLGGAALVDEWGELMRNEPYPRTCANRGR